MFVPLLSLLVYFRAQSLRCVRGSRFAPTGARHRTAVSLRSTAVAVASPRFARAPFRLTFPTVTAVFTFSDGRSISRPLKTLTKFNQHCFLTLIFAFYPISFHFQLAIWLRTNSVFSRSAQYVRLCAFRCCFGPTIVPFCINNAPSTLFLLFGTVWFVLLLLFTLSNVLKCK